MIDPFQNQHFHLLGRWVTFFLNLGALCILAFGIIPWIIAKAAPEVIHSAHTQGIDASALFYTESQVAGEAFNHLYNSRIQTENTSRYP